jgi:hypothetical protein
MKHEEVGSWVLTPRQTPTVKIPLLRRPNQFRIFFAWLLLGVEWQDVEDYPQTPIIIKE